MKISLLLCPFALLAASVACTVETTTPAPTNTQAPTTPEAEEGDEAAAPEEPSAVAPTAYTAAEAQALVDQRCGTCHGKAPMNLKGDFVAATAGVPSTQGSTLPLLTKGDRAKSYLFHKLAGTHASVGGTGVRMPKGRPAMTATELDRFGRFIDGL